LSEERMNAIRSYVAELAAMEYPKVWVGREGITVEELLFLQETNDKVPDWLRVEPGEFVGLEDTGVGVEIPSVSVDWLDGLYVLENLRDELPDEVYAGLYEEVL
jgi:hypothetical protein